MANNFKNAVLNNVTTVQTLYTSEAPGVVFTADNATNTFTSIRHGLIQDNIIRVSNSGGALPTGLSAATDYYLITVTANTWQLSTTKGGSAVAISDDGTGTQSFFKQVKSVLTDLNVANTTTGGITVTVDLTDSSGPTTVNIVKNAPIPTGSALILSEQKKILEELDYIEVTATGAVDVIAGILQDVS